MALGGGSPLSLRLRLRLAGLALWGEAAAPLLTILIWLLCLLAALALLRVHALVPSWVHPILLGLPCLGMGVAAWRLLRLPWPDMNHAMRRLESDSGDPHHSLDVVRDTLACGDIQLWERHRAAMEARSQWLFPGWPRAIMAERDPLGLRFAAPLLLVIACAVGASDWRGRMWEFITPRLGLPSLLPTKLEVWIIPPPHTGQPPIRLGGAATETPLRVPAGSLVKAFTGAVWGWLDLKAGAANADFRQEGEGRLAELKLGEAQSLSLSRWGMPVARWPLEIVPDQPPRVSFIETPSGDSAGRLHLRLTASDDYGVERMWLRLQPEDGSEPPRDVHLSASGRATRQVGWDGQLDVGGDDWAGQMVRMMPMTEDGGGWQAAGEPVVMEMPRRVFSHPVARALDQWRTALSLAPRSAPDIAQRLTGLLDDPESLEGDVRVVLALAVSRHRLMGGHGFDQDEIRDLLWSAAVRLEDGALPAARAELDEVRRLLELALADGASEQKVEALLNRLEEALERWAQALAETARPMDGVPPGAQVVDEDELASRLEDLRDLAGMGERRRLAAKLDELARLVERLEEAGRAPPPDPVAQARLERLNAIARDQQSLLDQSLHMAPPTNPEDESLDVEPRRAPVQREAGRRAARDQSALAEKVSGLSGASGSDLNRAQEAMRAAALSLAEGFWDEAVEAQALALTLLRQEASRQSRMLEGGQAGGGAVARRPGRGPLSDGRDTKVPGQTGRHPVRELIDEIRKRAGDAARPDSERGYMRRLLRTE